MPRDRGREVLAVWLVRGAAIAGAAVPLTLWVHGVDETDPVDRWLILVGAATTIFLSACLAALG